MIDSQRGRREVERAPVVEELHVQPLVGLGDAVELIDEIHVPRGAPELSVGRRLQTDVVLHGDDIADRRVLDLAQCGVADRARSFLSPCVHQRRRAKKTSDVVGAKGWLCASAHRVWSRSRSAR
jgi:hypothetical protein